MKMSKRNKPLGCYLIPSLFFGGLMLAWVLSILIDQVFPGSRLAQVIGVGLFWTGWLIGILTMVNGWFKQYG